MKSLFKNKNALLIFLGVIVGVLFIILNSVDSEKSTEIAENTSYPTAELESYTATLENKVCEHIEKINGVSNVSVLITIEGTNAELAQNSND